MPVATAARRCRALLEQQGTRFNGRHGENQWFARGVPLILTHRLAQVHNDAGILWWNAWQVLPLQLWFKTAVRRHSMKATVAAFIACFALTFSAQMKE